MSGKGYIGLVPANTEKGDQVAILSGAGTPYVIRKTKEEKMLLVGECYIHGAMNGKAFIEAGGVDALRPIIFSRIHSSRYLDTEHHKRSYDSAPPQWHSTRPAPPHP